MGIFDFLKKKKDSSDSLIKMSDVNHPKVIENHIKKSLTPYFGTLTIPPNIINLLLFADGQYKNYNPEADKRIVEDGLLRIEYSFGI
jgi:hypothetical protein